MSEERRTMRCVVGAKERNNDEEEKNGNAVVEDDGKQTERIRDENDGCLAR